MRNIHLSIHDIIAVVKRRRRPLLLSIMLVTFLCTVGAFLLPRKYESSTTILVQRDEILNPLVSFTMAVTMASEDRLRTFNEIIYSQATTKMLIDSLKLGIGVRTEKERQELIKEVQTKIETDRRGSDSFRITYTDEDPVRAQRGVLVLAHHFMKTVLTVENQRNEKAVEFFEEKQEDLRKKFEENQKAVVATMKERINELPLESRGIYTNIEETEHEIREINAELTRYQQEMNILKSFPAAMETAEGKRALFSLLRTDIPHVEALRPLLLRYEDLVQRYTANYPEVKKLTFQVLDMIGTMRSAVEAEIPKKRKQLWDREQRRAGYVEDLKKVSVSARVDEDKISNYDIYRKLYDEMKVKLEQARTTRDLGRTGSEQFIIIDPPLVPSEPAKPRRMLIILGGFALGVVLGIVSAATAEILDTTIRSPRDIKVYKKPVIAFLPESTARPIH